MSGVSIDGSSVSEVTVDGVVVFSTGVVASADLVAYYKFDDSSTASTAIDSANANDASINGAAYFGSGQVGSDSLDFNGSGDNVATSLPSRSGDVSVAAWFYPISSGADASYAVNRYGNGSWWILGGGSGGATTGNWSFQVDDGSSNPSVDSGVSISTQNWTHVVAKYDDSSGQLEIYVNGSSVGSKSVSISTPTYNNTFAVGGNVDANNKYFPGRIDDVRIYNRPLQDSEVSSIYNNTK